MDDRAGQTRLKQRTLAFAMLAVVALWAGLAAPHNLIVRSHEHTSMLTVHLLMELFAIVIAMLVLVVSWNTFNARQSRSANILISGFLIVVSCDVFHALTYEGMPALLAPSSTQRAIFFWLMGRTFEVSTMALVAVEFAPALRRRVWLGAGIVIASALIWFGSYRIDDFPNTFVEGQGVTPFKADYEYVLCLLNILVAVLFWKRATASGERRYYILALSSFIMGVGEVMFTAYVTPSDFQNIYGHAYKLVAYALLYRATFVTSLRAPFDLIRESEHRLHESEERWKFALEGSGDGVWDVNLATGVALHSKRYQEMLGYAEGEFGGSYNEWLDHLHPDDRPCVLALLQAYLDGKSPSYAVEYRMRGKDGRYRWISSRGIIVSRTADAKPLRMIGTHADITERKAADDELEQHRIHLERMVEKRTAELSVAKNAAEAASVAKSEFLAHMSHEIRTPMNAIVGAARLMEYERLTKRQRGYTAIMRHSSQTLLALIDDILDLSKIEAGCIDFKMARFDLVDVIAAVTGVATVLTQNKNVELKFSVAPDLPARFIGDPLRLEQVLNNLFSNAIKFTAHGAITFCVQKVFADEKNARLRFVLTDTGTGIPPDKLDTIFEPFTQADSFITRSHAGTGLGLAISRQLVEMMGGTIEVESVLGHGSQFAFTADFELPAAAESALSAAGLADPAMKNKEALSRRSALAGRRVLMVEDNEFNRHVLEGILHHFGIEVDAAFDGHDGIECFQVGGPYDAILMDLHLPGLDGFACTRAIRALPQGRQVPIVALTANVLPTTANACLAAGMNDHLVKPVEPEVLERSLIHWILSEKRSAAAKAGLLNEAQDDRFPDHLPGIDQGKASGWSNGSCRALAKLLDRALAHSGDDPKKLVRHIAAGDLEAAAQITHDLMAVAATVGASALVSAARQLNQEIRSGRPDGMRAREALNSIGAEFARLDASREILRQRLDLAASIPATAG